MPVLSICNHNFSIEEMTVKSRKRIQIKTFPDLDEGIVFIYNGAFCLQKDRIIPHGRGILSSPDRKIYDGNWKNGKYDGYGISFFKNGNKQYEGNWINHKFDEKGILYYNNEKNTPYYRGTVFKNNITGKGIYYDFHGKKNYQGDVFHDKRHGKGTEYTHDGKVVYFGNWQRNKYNGMGVSLSSTSGLVHYYGSWEDGKKTGKGMLYWPSGHLRYIGEWEDNKQNGYGIAYNRDSSMLYFGYWRKNKFHGFGRLFSKSGRNEHDGYFVNGTTHVSLMRKSKTITLNIQNFLNSNDDYHIENLSVDDLKNYLNLYYHKKTNSHSFFQVKNKLQKCYRDAKHRIKCEEAMDYITFTKITNPVICNDEIIYNKSTIEKVWENAPSNYNQNLEVVKVYPKLLGGVRVHSYYTLNDLQSSKDIPNKKDLKTKLNNFIKRHILWI